MRRFLLALPVLALAACSRTPEGTTAQVAADKTATPQIDTVLHDYVVGFLKRDPVTNTYLGGAGLDPALADADGRLRDWSPDALKAEDAWLASVLAQLERMDTRSLSADQSIDRAVAIAQIRFQLHQHQERHYPQRALDTYTDQPFRGVDWLLQGMGRNADGSYGTRADWQRLADRLSDVPRFMQAAVTQLKAGIATNNTPDWRMLKRNGLDTTLANAEYFATTLPGIAAERMPKGEGSDALLSSLRDKAAKAADAYRGLHDFVAETYFANPKHEGRDALKPQFRDDRYMLDEKEYDWALKNNLHVDLTAAQLFDNAMSVADRTRSDMAILARSIGKTRGWTLPADDNAAVRAVFDQLSKDYPKDDAQMVAWYRDAAFRLVDFARKTGLFQVPDDYKLDVVETPPPLRTAIDGAAYYPAPPFKNTGVGVYYVTPTGNDRAALQSNNRAALADLSAHEGFPGHDWYYKVMTRSRDQISPVRWLTPGSVEDSSSMWEDSMSAEGWAHYAEALMAEPAQGAPNGFYTPEERLYQLHGQLYRDVRVYVDTGIHTGRLSYDDAVDLFSRTVDFLPGKCGGKTDEVKRASCRSAESAIFRYSKWPTQAITYHLGKDRIYALRERAQKQLGARYSSQAFHNAFISQGTIPSDYFGDRLIEVLESGAK